VALVNSIDPDHARRRLEPWLAARLGVPAVTVTDVVVPRASGVSNETVLLDATWEQDGDVRRRSLVVRVAPPAGTGVTPTTYDLGTELAVLRALRGSAVPVPEALWHEPDADLLGGPFLVLERLPGRTLADDPPFTVSGWIHELDPVRRRTLDDAALGALVAVHATDPARLADVPGLLRTVEERIALYEAFYARVAGAQRVPAIEAGFAWLREHRPDEPAEPGVSWGDARPGNLLLTDDGAVAGVLDWEMVGLGAPELDLGWWLFFLRHHTEGIGAPLPEGLRDRDATIARYEELAGRAVDREAVAFHEAFAGLRAAVMMVRAAQLMTDAGLLPPDNGMASNNLMLQLFCALAGMPAPDGDGVHFIGNR
jgi:aminoglycoside phosphotransferase (APT) family kinase protein